MWGLYGGGRGGVRCGGCHTHSLSCSKQWPCCPPPRHRNSGGWPRLLSARLQNLSDSVLGPGCCLHVVAAVGGGGGGWLGKTVVTLSLLQPTTSDSGGGGGALYRFFVYSAPQPTTSGGGSLPSTQINVRQRWKMTIIPFLETGALPSAVGRCTTITAGRPPACLLHLQIWWVLFLSLELVGVVSLSTVLRSGVCIKVILLSFLKQFLIMCMIRVFDVGGVVLHTMFWGCIK